MLIGCVRNNQNKIKSDVQRKDSIAFLIDKASKKNIALKLRKEKLEQAYDLAKQETIDSVKNKYFLAIAYKAYKLDAPVLLKQVNDAAYKLSKEIKDTAGMAETHWNYGLFFGKKEKMDSAYYHYFEAGKLYKTIHHDFYYGKMLYNMAFVQGRLRDYTGSEKLTYQAIGIFKPLKKYKNLYMCYNHLGLVFTELEEYDKAIYYHNEALEYLKEVKNKKNCREGSLNNLSLVYGEQGNYEVAIVYIDEALKGGELKLKDINLYARLIDNKAYYKFLSGDSTNVLKEFHQSLKIRDSLHKEAGIVINKIHLAEFYARYNDTAKAITNAKQAYILAKKVNNNRDKLASLKLLSQLDKKKSNTFLNEYILLNDSLQKEERKIRNKFARIRFETDEYFQETQRLSEQKMWILLVGFFIIFILSLLYYIIRQQSKNKELIFEQNQQKSNEEIYSLILKQQTKLEEGRIEERNRISEELHDGVLGKLFGTRMGLGFLHIKGDNNTVQKYQSHIKDIQQIEKEIRALSRKLKNEELFSNSNFMISVKELVSKQSEIGGFKYIIESDENITWNKVDEIIKINLYRMLQETLQNINKHAKATHVEIIFNLEKGILITTIKDNGIGFDIEKKKKKKKGIGLKNMLSRSKKLNGTFVINSSINNGTISKISIPLKL